MKSKCTKFLLPILLMVTMLTPTYAAVPPYAARGGGKATMGTMTLSNQEGQKWVIDLADLDWIQYDENGNVIPTPRVAIDKHTIRNGATVKCYNDGDYFHFTAGQVVHVQINMDHDAKLRVGFTTADGNYSGNTLYNESETNSFELEDTDDYYFFIENLSADSVTVSGKIYTK